MKIKSVKSVGNKNVYDISVEDVQHYALENGAITHNTGVMYSADTVWIIGRQQEKDSDKALAGYNFIINVEKSRFVKEKSKIPITVNFDGGISKYSGLSETAVDGGYLTKVKISRSNGLQAVNKNTGELIGEPMLEKDIKTNFRFWKNLFENTDFKEHIYNKYAIGTGNIMSNDEEVIEDELENEED